MSKDNTNQTETIEQKLETIEQKLEVIREDSVKEKIVLLKSAIDLQSDTLKQDMTHLIKKTLCDKTYPNALSKKDIEIQSIGFDFETLEIVIEDDIELADTTSVFLLALFTVNGAEIRIGAWITINYSMQLNQGDFSVGTDRNDIDCNFNHGNIIKEILKVINETQED